MEQQKQILRAQLVAERRAFTPQQRCLTENMVCKALLMLPEYAAAQTVLCYVSAQEEFSTTILLAHALLCGKRVGVPRWSRQSGMEFCAFTDYHSLLPSKTGLLQPPTNAPVLPPDSRTLCIVPALAVDKNGYRMGYGGGYYDRFLAKFTGFAVTPLHSSSLLRPLPTAPHDIPVHCIVLPQGVTYTKQTEETNT